MENNTFFHDNEFTPKGLELIDEIYNEYIGKSTYRSSTDEELIDAVRTLYSLGNEPIPEKITVCGSPLEMQKKAEEMTGEKQEEAWYGNLSDFGWLANIDAGIRMGLIEDDKDFQSMKKASVESGIWSSILMDDMAFVCRRPPTQKMDEDMELHCMDGAAVIFEDGARAHFIHGIFFTPDQFAKIATVSIPELMAWEDIDQRSVLLRERPVKDLLDGIENKKLIDSTEECGGYELWEVEFDGIGKTKILSYKGWSSQKPYVKFAKPEATNALEAIAELREMTVDEFRNAIKS